MHKMKPFDIDAVVSSFKEVFEHGDIDKLTPTAHDWMKKQKGFGNHMIQDYNLCKRMYANAIGYLAYDLLRLSSEHRHLNHPRFVEAYGEEYIHSRLEIIRQVCDMIEALDVAEED